jgi:hypothetical protein
MKPQIGFSLYLVPNGIWVLKRIILFDAAAETKVALCPGFFLVI